MTTTQAIEAIEQAQGSWTTADWTHEAGVEMADQSDPDEQPVYCSGGVDGCTVCADATRDAADADAHGDRAIGHLERGSIALAVAAVEEASDLERAYGDDPIWRPALEAVRAILRVGDRVDAGEGEDYDAGRITAIRGDQATVAWDSLTETTQDASLLTRE